MTEHLIHFSPKPLTKVRSVEQPVPGAAARYDKPSGLWVSVEGNGDGWLDWCRGEDFDIGDLAYEVVLSQSAKILRLCSADDIDIFTERYGDNDAPDYLMRYAIRWRDVAAKYQGIIISPYCWARRFHETTGWYYGWDCASGCIWSEDAVADIRPAPLDIFQGQGE